MTPIPDVAALKLPGVGPALDAVLVRALAKHPDGRQRSTSDFLAELIAAASG